MQLRQKEATHIACDMPYLFIRSGGVYYVVQNKIVILLKSGKTADK